MRAKPQAIVVALFATTTVNFQPLDQTDNWGTSILFILLILRPRIELSRRILIGGNIEPPLNFSCVSAKIG